MSKGSNRRPESERGDYHTGYDAIKWSDEKPKTCTVCGRELVNGLCPEQERTQREIT